MSILVDDAVLRVTPGVIQGEANGHHYGFNPRGHFGVVLFPPGASELLKFCSAGATVAEIQRALPWAHWSPWKLSAVLARFERTGILEAVESRTPGGRTRIKRLGRRMAVWLQITDACNLRCSYCYVSKKPSRMNLETAKALISRIGEQSERAGYESLLLKLAGGEPVTEWRLAREIINWTHDSPARILRNATFLLVTNGTLLPQDLVDYAADGRLKLSISVDGVGAPHDRHRVYFDGRGSFDDVQKNLESLLSRGVSPSLTCTITKENVGSLTEFAKYCLERDLNFRFSPYRQPANASESLKSDNDTLIAELLRCYSWLETRLPKRSLYEVHRFADINLKKPKTWICSIGTNAIALASDGKACLCQFDLEHPVGNALTENIFQILKDQIRYPLDENRVDLIPECENCRWRYTCAGGCPLCTQNQYGTYRHASPYCEVYQAVLPALLRLHAVQQLQSFDLQEPNGQ